MRHRAEKKLKNVALRAPDFAAIEHQRNATVESPQILTIINDPRERDTSESEGETTEENIKCPEIEVQIERVNVRGLVDTGSPISCISEEFYKEDER